MRIRPLPSVLLLGLACVSLVSGMVLAQDRPETRPLPMAQLVPSISGLDPPTGPPGTQVLIQGAHLEGVHAVLFSPSLEAPFIVLSDSALQTTVPQGAQSGPIQVVAAQGIAKSEASFSVVAP